MISIVINTYNAERHLAKVLDSVKDFDEVVICDMESTDSTLNIAHRYGCKVVTFPKEGHTIVEPARNFAIQSASYPWVLVVDADEIVPKALREYLYRQVSLPCPPDGIYIPRRNYFMGTFMHSLYPDYILRFFRKDKTVWPPIIHVQPEVAGNVIHAPKHKGLAFEHLADDSLSDRLRKTDTYTDYECKKNCVIYDIILSNSVIIGKARVGGIIGYVQYANYTQFKTGMANIKLDGVKIKNNSAGSETTGKFIGYLDQYHNTHSST